jgi:hypothetical protein
MTAKYFRIKLSFAILLVTVLIIMNVFATSTPVFAATIQVPRDYSTVQAAINAAAAGDTILVDPGTYVEILTINKSITLQATSYDTENPRNNTTIIDGANTTGSVIAILSGVSPQPHIIGFTIRNGNDGIRPNSPFTVEHSYFTSATDLIDFSGGSCGVVRNNVFFGSSDDSIDLDHVNCALLIENNQLISSGQDGIEIRLQDDVIAQTAVVTIRGNSIESSIQDGIQFIDYSTDTNRMYKIERNLFLNNKRSAIGMMDNQVTNEDYRAASIREAVHIFNNTFVGNNYGITGGDRVVAVNNIFMNTTNMALKNVDAESSVSHTLFWNNGTNHAGSNVDAFTMIADPLLTTDYALQTGSPAIDAGTARYEHNGALVLDYPSSSYSGSAPDVGWQESDFRTYAPVSLKAFQSLSTSLRCESQYTSREA